MNLEDKINLYFFSPREPLDNYKSFYKTICANRYATERNRIRYPSLYLLRRDIRHCLNLGQEYNPVRQNIGEAIFPAILLIRIAFTETVKKVLSFEGIRDYQERLNVFGKKYMGIEDESLLKALGVLRNSLEHSNYSLYRTEDGVKYYFSLGYFNDVIALDNHWHSTEPSYHYLVNPKKLYSNMDVAFRKLKEDLVNTENTHLREHFDRMVDINTWTLIG